MSRVSSRPRPSPFMIRTFSRAGIEAYEPMVPCAVLSFRDPGTPVPRLPRGAPALCLAFHDVDQVPPGADWAAQVRLFDAAMAFSILEFVSGLARQIEVLAIHCEAGISRSVSAGVALRSIYGLPVPAPAPPALNQRVYRLLLQAHHARSRVA